MGAQAFALNSPLPNGGNPGQRRYRKVAVTAAETVWGGGECAVYAMLFRNASTSPVYVNFYDKPGNVTVGTGSGTAVAARIMVPAASSATIPGQLIITNAPDALDWFANGLTIAPVTTDSDSAAAGGSVYVELKYVGFGS